MTRIIALLNMIPEPYRGLVFMLLRKSVTVAAAFCAAILVAVYYPDFINAVRDWVAEVGISGVVLGLLSFFLSGANEQEHKRKVTEARYMPVPEDQTDELAKH